MCSRKSFLLAAALTAAALAAALAACAGGDGSDERVALSELLAAADGGVYLALGDSVAAGSGASDPSTTGYVALVAAALQPRFGDALQVRTLAEPGATTADLIADQLPLAVTAMQEGDVRLVTVTIGGNDLAQYGADPACVLDPADAECPLEDGLLEVEQRLAGILIVLTEAAPAAVTVIQLYPNLFSGTGHELTMQAETAFGLLNGVITGVAARFGVPLADPRRDFAGAGTRLTHLLDRPPDAHPNDDGYAAIAEAFLEALEIEEE